MVGGVEVCGRRVKCVTGVEVCGGRGEGVWDVWRSVVGGVRCVVRGVEVSVGRVEVCGRE